MKLELPLKDIHLPDPVNWWPPAPGWWVLVMIAIVATVIVIHYCRKHRRDMVLYDSAKSQLKQIRQHYQQTRDSLQLIKELSVVLRRVAISITFRKQAAGLTGESWLVFLDSIVDKPLFNSDTGRQLLSAPYQSLHIRDAEALLEISEQWLLLASRSKKKRVSHV